MALSTDGLPSLDDIRANRRPAHPAAAAGVLAGVALFHVVDHQLVPRQWHLATHLAGTAAAVAAGRLLGLDALDLGLDPAGIREAARTGGLVATAIGAGVTAAALLPAAEPLFADRRVTAASRGTMARWALVEIPVATAAYEEVLFRGVLLGLARQRWSTPVAVAVTSALFGCWHVLPALEDHAAHPATAQRTPAAAVAGTVVATTVAGAAFAGLRLRTGSLLAPVLAHTATNAIPLVAARAVQRRVRRRAAGGPAPGIS